MNKRLLKQLMRERRKNPQETFVKKLASMTQKYFDNTMSQTYQMTDKELEMFEIIVKQINYINVNFKRRKIK